VSTLWLGHTPSSAAVARRSVLAAFDDAGLTGEPALDAALIASELVGNAVRHATPLPSGQLAVGWVLDAEGYQISVTDGGGTSDPDSLTGGVSARRAGARDTAGRGLRIVAELADSWGVATDDDGATTVWARASTPACAAR
jgi:anti-sigma regulatory factor (Ser/Thr protein kinase)